MKRIILAASLFLLAMSGHAQTTSPFDIYVDEFLLGNQLLDYKAALFIDLQTGIPDTSSFLKVEKNSQAYYTDGYELIFPGRDSANWECSINGNINTIDIFEPVTQDTVQRDILEFDSQNRLSKVTLEAPMQGSTSLEPVNQLDIFQGSNGPDSIHLLEYNGSTWEDMLHFEAQRDAQGRLDEVLLNVNFQGSWILGTRVKYHYSGGIMDSANVIDPNTSEIQVKLIPDYNSNGKINSVTFWEKDNFGEYLAVNRIEYLSDGGGLGSSNTEKTALNVFPNPASRMLNMEGIPKNSSVQIVNASGQVVQEGKISKERQQVNIETLAKGVYFLKIEGPKGTQSMRFIKE